MPRNGSGTFSLLVTFVSGTPATAADQNTQDGDIATALTQSLCTDGQSTMTGAIKGYSGTVSAPGYAFSSGLTSGLYLAGAGQIGMATLGAAAMTWNNDQTVTFSSVANLNLPNGTTAQRPVTPAAGMARYNSTTASFEYYAASWVAPITGAATQSASAGALYGLVGSTSAGDPTNDIDVTVGSGRDSTNVQDIVVAALSGKQLDASWVAGSNAGMRSSAGLANGTWHIFAICKTDGSAGDIFAHTGLDPTSVLPAGYTYFRRVFSILRESAANVPFVQYGDYFTRKTIAADVSSNNPGTSAVTRTLSVPTGLSIIADIFLAVGNAGSGTNVYALATDLSDTDDTPASTLTQIGGATSGSVVAAAPVQVRTNSSGQIRSRISGSDANITLRIATRGWYDNRGITQPDS